MRYGFLNFKICRNQILTLLVLTWDSLGVRVLRGMSAVVAFLKKKFHHVASIVWDDGAGRLRHDMPFILSRSSYRLTRHILLSKSRS
jgi:hypothetical protein